MTRVGLLLRKGNPLQKGKGLDGPNFLFEENVQSGREDDCEKDRAWYYPGIDPFIDRICKNRGR
jgi:hypothetical protein